jgi:hypothetical protein
MNAPILLAVDEPAADVAGVLERMAAIDAALPAADGVAYFNRLYRKVTEEVDSQIAGAGYEDDEFLGRLDVRFANLFFDAVAADARGEPPARPWRPLFEGRNADAAPVQFALVGMNAHINHDLSVALVDVCRDMALAPARETPQYRDFDRTNEVLELVQGRIKQWFAVGLIAAIDEALGKVDDAMAMWSITAARRFAWTQAETLWQLQDNPHLLAAYRASLERMVGFAGRSLLL